MTDDYYRHSSIESRHQALMLADALDRLPREMARLFASPHSIAIRDAVNGTVGQIRVCIAHFPRVVR